MIEELEPEEENTQLTEMDHIADRMKEVMKYGLETEVIYYALCAMQGDPSISIIEAFEHGCSEWDV